jgi:two-component system nitrate/nitrite sensor histidine kinase NarX
VGLQIMRERAARIGAVVDVASAPGAGTEVRLHLPVAQRQAA